MSATLRGADIAEYSDENENRIEGTPRTVPASAVQFHGKNCHLVFGSQVSFRGSIIFHRDNSTVIIGDRSLFRGRTTLGEGCQVVFGEDIYTGIDLQISTAEGADVILGDGLLIANGVRIRADDSHPIYDAVTGQRLNSSTSIHVGSRVWLGQESFVLPGSNVGDGSVVGARSVVTKSRPIPENTLVVGSPARVQRRDIYWVRKHLQTSHDIDECIEPPTVNVGNDHRG